MMPSCQTFQYGIFFEKDKKNTYNNEYRKNQCGGRKHLPANQEIFIQRS
jgi:hypothetical protein